MSKQPYHKFHNTTIGLDLYAIDRSKQPVIKYVKTINNNVTSS